MWIYKQNGISKIINFLDNDVTQPSRFRIKNWVEINDGACETYNTNSQIKFETTALKPNLCDYVDAYMLVQVTVTVVTQAAEAAAIAAGRNVTQGIF